MQQIIAKCQETTVVSLCLAILAYGAPAQPGPCRLSAIQSETGTNLYAAALAAKSDPLLSAYPNCVEARARALETTRNSLDEIASQAIHACKRERAIFAEAMEACGDAKFVRGELEGQDRMLRQLTRVAVGEFRAQRRSLPDQDNLQSNPGSPK